MLETGSNDEKNLARCELLEQLGALYKRVVYKTLQRRHEGNQKPDEEIAKDSLAFAKGRLIKTKNERESYERLLAQHEDWGAGKYRYRHVKANKELSNQRDRIEREETNCQLMLTQ